MLVWQAQIYYTFEKIIPHCVSFVPNLWGTPYVPISQLTRIDESLFNSPLLVQRVLYLLSFVQKTFFTITSLRFQSSQISSS